MTSSVSTDAIPSAGTACIVCGSRTRARRYAGFAFLECPACGLAALADAPSRGDYWTSELHDEHIDEAFWIRAKEAYFRSALGILASLTGGRRLIDVGGGVGFFAQLALDDGWDAVSLDVSETATALAAERVGPERALQRLDEGVDRFDVATLWCVVAHTLTPATVLETVRAALKPGGLLWLTTPNFVYHKRYAALRRALHRPGDFASDEHLLHFTPDSLTEFLRREGFGDIRFHYAGVVRTCLITGSDADGLVLAKRGWNAAAYGLSRVGMPNVMSELQVTCRLTAST
jgi:SAM-dependent methyltransferase